MLQLIILAWILSVLSAPALIWVLYGLLCGMWAISALVKLIEWAE
jgi:hypothetical protein